MGDADRLPMANVSRIIQNSLPKDSAIAKEARVALSACATVFVHYITELAVQQCDKRKKVTLTPDDIVEALREAEFEDFEQPMKEALAQYRTGGAGSVKKGVGSISKKQKLDDNANGTESPTRAEPYNKEGEDEAEDDGEEAEGGPANGDDKMEGEDEAEDDEGKDDEDKGKDEEKEDANEGEIDSEQLNTKNDKD